MAEVAKSVVSDPEKVDEDVSLQELIDSELALRVPAKTHSFTKDFLTAEREHSDASSPPLLSVLALNQQNLNNNHNNNNNSEKEDEWTTVEEVAKDLQDETENHDQIQEEHVEIIEETNETVETVSHGDVVSNGDCIESETMESSVTKKKKKNSIGEGDTIVTKTKKTKKTKKTEEKENHISVMTNGHNSSERSLSPPSVVKDDELSNVCVRNLGGESQATSTCKSCGKTVFAMEQIKAEKAVWHKNCFRCQTCNKQLTVDIYSSHEGTLYCKPHFKELFKPKAVVEDEEPASDKPDLGLEELSSLNVKSRFQVFEKQDATDGELERSPTTVSVKRSSSILSKLAKFQKKGMDVGVSNDALAENGFVYEASSSSSEEEDEDDDEETGIVKCRRKNAEKPVAFVKIDDVKKNWESQTDQHTRREMMREQKREELQALRSRMFQGKQGKMKELYEQAVAESEGKPSKNSEDIVRSEKAKAVREKFEKGETARSDDEDEVKEKKTESPEREVYRDPDVVRCDDRVDDEQTVKKSMTTSKMLSMFRQLEEQKEVIPEGPKPKKCFTPPPDYRGSESDETEEEEDEDEEDEEEEEDDSEREDGVVKSSYKVKDEFLEQARNAAKAKQLAAKFESWEPDKQSTNNAINMLDSEHASIDSTKSLRAKFESLKTEQPKEKSRPKVNRFVEAANMNLILCASCDTKVYQLEKVETNGKTFHKQCFRCAYCKCILRMDTYTLNNGQLYCLPHFKQLFISKGNYDEGFGSNQHKHKWDTPAAN